MDLNPISTNHTYDVAIILINYNSSSYTIECINSILAMTSQNISYGIVVVDNASEKDDYNSLAKSLDQLDSNTLIYLFRSNINTGFSTGNMLGVQFIVARYYFFLNNDCILLNDSISILYQFCEQNPQVALCSPQLFNDDGSIQPCFNYFPFLVTKLFGLGILQLSYGSRYKKRKAHYTTPIQVDIVSGSQMFVRASAFNEIGGFDTILFLYCEEEDLAYRLAQKNWLTYLVPNARNMHHGGGSTTQSFAIKQEFYISFLYFYRKHFGFIKQQIMKLILAVKLARKAFVKPANLKLALFVLSGAHLKNSLRFKQKIWQYPIA